MCLLTKKKKNKGGIMHNMHHPHTKIQQAASCC